LEYKTNDNVYSGVPTVEWCGMAVPRVWRAGNRGTVASVLIEKPVCGDFLPIIDGGFSLQYSPLMEYRHGKGMILFCQMDVTGRSEDDPAALHLVGNILRYVDKWKPQPKRIIEYAGDKTGRDYLEKIGASLADVEMHSKDYYVLVLGTNGARPDNATTIAQWRTDTPGLAIGLNQNELKHAFPELTVKSEEHISTYFEPFGMDSPLRGISSADLHNRDPKNYPLITHEKIAVGNGILAVLDGGRTVICGLAPWQFPNDKQSFKKTFNRSAFVLARTLGNMNVDMRTPLVERFHSAVGKDEKRWLTGLYLDEPVEWDDPYRFFRW
jgi:hypothetical protein